MPRSGELRAGAVDVRGDGLLMEKAVTLPALLFMVALSWMSPSPLVFAGLGVGTIAFNLAISYATYRKRRHARGRQVSLALPERLRAPGNLAWKLAMVWVAYPAPGWLVVPSAATLEAGMLGGRSTYLVIGGHLAATCILLLALGAAPETVLLCISLTALATAVSTASALRLRESRANLREVVEEAIMLEREHGNSLLSAQRSSRLASVGQLAAGVAHEINNPLTYVISNIEFILESGGAGGNGSQDSPAAQIHEAASDALEGAHRVRRIVHGIKLFSRLDREVVLTPVDVNEVVTASLDIARNEIRHRAELIVDLAEGLPNTMADKGRLGQVFINLLINAAQAVPEKDASLPAQSVTVKTSLNDEGQIVVRVQDSGVGIAQDKLQKIFEPFYTTKAVGEGTGLGLAIAHGIVADLGGDIQVESTLGEGAAFSIVLPAAKAKEAKVEHTAKSSQQRTPEGLESRVLIIDDEALVAKSLARTLRQHDTTIAHSGEEALRILAGDADFDMIFCDLMMPTLSGPAFFGRLKEEFPKLSRNLIFVTGGVFSDSTQSFLEQSGAPCLYKPFSAVTVADAIYALQDKQDAAETSDSEPSP